MVSCYIRSSKEGLLLESATTGGGG